MRIATAADVRALDLEAITELGIPGAVLMEVAGRGATDALFDALRAQGLAEKGVRVGVLCGAGNNGGDGYVIARLAASRGADVRVYQCAPRSKEAAPGDDGALNLAILRRVGGVPVLDCTTEARLDEHRASLQSEEVLVDALLGTGATRAPAGAIARAIAFANTNALARLRLAVDLPSGLHADTGGPLGEVFRTDVTVTFAVPKVGLVSWPGVERTGRLVVVDIGIPPALTTRRLGWRLLDDEEVRARLPLRPLGGHKGTFGHVLVVAGAPGTTGAALLAARGAARAGAGLVTIAAPAASRAALEARVLEEMTAALPEAGQPDFAEVLSALCARKHALVIGPGAGQGPTTAATIAHALDATELPVVLDADALGVVAADRALRDRVVAAGARVALTPHPGEAAKLLGVPHAEVQSDRVAAARRIASEWQCAVALKGARTVLAGRGDVLAINPTGNVGLASGGTGDVLAGAVGALCGQGLEPFDALAVGAYLHGRAADLRVATRGVPVGLRASEVADALPDALATLRR